MVYNIILLFLFYSHVSNTCAANLCVADELDCNVIRAVEHILESWHHSLAICELKMPSKWENCARNGLICFFRHNYIPTFEQWLWDRVCVLYTWFGDICCSRRDLYVLQKVTITFFQILFVAAAYEMTNVISRACKQKCTLNWPPPPCEAATNCAVWSPLCESAGAAAIYYNVSWYFVFKEVVRYAAHRVWYSFASVVHDFLDWEILGCLQLIGMRVVLYQL